MLRGKIYTNMFKDIIPLPLQILEGGVLDAGLMMILMMMILMMMMTMGTVYTLS